MMTSNNALVPDPDKEDILASKPLDWPFLHLGLRMCGWGDNQIKYYLLGTPIIYWGGAVSLIASVFVVCGYLLRIQRKYVDMEPRMSCFGTIVRVLTNFQENGPISFMSSRLHSSAGFSIFVSDVHDWRNSAMTLLQSHF